VNNNCNFQATLATKKAEKSSLRKGHKDMKELIFIWVILLLLTSSCQKEKDENSFLLDQNFDPKYNEMRIDAEDRLVIALDSVLNDSRCPKGCYCFWAGNAEVRFSFSNDVHKIKFVLNTFSGWRTDTLINEYRIKLLDVKPYPEAGRIINQNDYHAEIRITRE
jgi:hypothetical protein